LAGATRCALYDWDGLVRFLADGRIEMDTNTVERAMGAVASNRRNALFAGSRRVAWSRGIGAVAPPPLWVQAMRTEVRHPSSSMRLSAWTATLTSVARRRSVRARSPSPMTCLNRPMAGVDGVDQRETELALPRRCLGDLDGEGLCRSDHPVQHRDGDGDLTLLCRQAAGAQLRADQVFVARHRRFV